MRALQGQLLLISGLNDINRNEDGDGEIERRFGHWLHSVAEKFQVGLVAAFAAVNGVLMATGTIPVDADGFGLILAAGVTLALYSFLYKDNPLFKFAEHVFVGVAAAYVFGQYWYPTIYGEIIAEWSEVGEGETINWWLLAPTALGLLMLTRFSLRFIRG